MSLYARLCGWRLRHLAEATFRLLVRRWHATVFLLLLLSPAQMPLAEQVHLLATPVLQMVDASNAARGAGAWIALLLLAGSWSALQGQALAGGHAWDHLAALPVAPRVLQGVDLTVLAIADLPLWLPFLAALVSLAAAPTPAAASIATVLALACQLPVLQWLALRRSRHVAPCLLGSLAGFAALGASGQPWLLCFATMAGTIAGLAGPVGAGARGSLRARRGGRPWLTLRAHWRPAVQMGVIDLRSLGGAGALVRHFGLLLTMVMPVPLLAFLEDAEIQPAAMTIALLLFLPALLLRVSALALDLKRLHLPMQRLHASLGVPAAAVFRTSLVALSIVFVVVALPLSVALCRASATWRAVALLPIGIAAMVAMAWVDRGGGRGHLVSRVAIAALACVAVYALL